MYFKCYGTNRRMGNGGAVGLAEDIEIDIISLMSVSVVVME